MKELKDCDEAFMLDMTILRGEIIQNLQGNLDFAPYDIEAAEKTIRVINKSKNYAIDEMIKYLKTLKIKDKNE